MIHFLNWTSLPKEGLANTRDKARINLATEGEGEVIATVATDSLPIDGRYASTIRIIIGTAQIVSNPFLQSRTPGHIALYTTDGDKFKIFSVFLASSYQNVHIGRTLSVCCVSFGHFIP